MASRNSVSKRRVAKKTKRARRKYVRKAEVEQNGLSADAPSRGVSMTLTQRTHAAEARAAEAEAKHAGILDRFEKAERANNDYVQRICHERDHAMQVKDAEIGYLRTTLSRLTLGGVFVTGTMKT